MQVLGLFHISLHVCFFIYFIYVVMTFYLTDSILVPQCDALSEVVHGTYEPTNCTTSKQDSGSVCTLTCQPGYYPDAKVTLQCTKTSEWWSPTIAQCEGMQVIVFISHVFSSISTHSFTTPFETC